MDSFPPQCTSNSPHYALAREETSTKGAWPRQLFLEQHRSGALQPGTGMDRRVWHRPQQCRPDFDRGWLARPVVYRHGELHPEQLWERKRRRANRQPELDLLGAQRSGQLDQEGQLPLLRADRTRSTSKGQRQQHLWVFRPASYSAIARPAKRAAAIPCAFDYISARDRCCQLVCPLHFSTGADAAAR